MVGYEPKINGGEGWGRILNCVEGGCCFSSKWYGVKFLEKVVGGKMKMFGSKKSRWGAKIG